jgi:catechol 2,3-dioxygenase-like lactoylglutathione lyase family enzyme
MASEIRLALVILAVRDLPRAVAFYREAFGWPITVSAPVYAEFQLPREQRLGLYHHEGFQRNVGHAPALVPPGRIASAELYFYADDVPEALTRVEAAGARAISGLAARDWGDEAAYFADPDGNVIVIARPLPAAAQAGA